MKYSEDFPSLYQELADWWPVLSTPDDYAEEARFYQQVITTASSKTPKTLLELGSGGGNNASHLKPHFEMTLVDLSLGMLEVSKRLNPECKHIQGDMRTVRLECQFDAVFVQDAIMYMLTESDLYQAIESAYVHCQPGGVALFAPDSTRETFKESTRHGGHDLGERGLRYIDWTYDPDDTDTTYVSDMVYLLRDGAGQVRCVHDRHLMGLFGHDDWLRLITQAGFRASSLPFEHSEVEPGTAHVFVGIKPGHG